MKMAAGGDDDDGGIAIDPHTFELLSPSRFISFTFPNPHPHNNYPYCYSNPLLRIAVLDSPIISSSSSDHPHVAAMLVPIGREHDWIFSTQTGHLHLLLSSSSSSSNPSCSRLILVGNLPSQPEPEPRPYIRPISVSDPDPDPLHQFQDSILPFLLALSPKSAFRSGIPKIPFLSYDDDVARILPVNHLVSPIVGEMLVEDVELAGGRELRRRLRFKRMPNLVQSQVRLVNDALSVGTFRPETGSLVQPYLGPMVAALSLLVPDLGPATKALCVGVGGVALLMCLSYQFGFNIIGVEADDVVLSVSKRHFGLIEDEFLKIVVGDGIELVELRKKEFLDGFDLIMVDLDSGDALSGIFVPPLEFVNRNVRLGARLALHEKGIMVVNVIPPNGSFYKRLVDSLHEVFAELYEIDVGNGENYVLISAASTVRLPGNENKGPLFEKLKQVGVDRFVEHMKKI